MTAESPAANVPHVLIVGGGPDPTNNQVAIESNVRYVTRLLPPGTVHRTLFADGRVATKDVEYEDVQGDHFRASTLKTIDGPSRRDSFHREITSLGSNSPAGLLLYFTGHGSPARMDYDDNRYDLWGNEELSVRHLADEIAALPKGEPVTVVMVQCFSGAFANLLFDKGSPSGSLIDRPVCGFFASLAPRMAAGCTPEIDETDYHDFTGYFFAALSGVDRTGHPVLGADFNKDGRVGMDEAYAYALVHDESIDTPVCTSDVFLRRYVKGVEATLFQQSYATVRGWASPAQAAALDALSTRLHLSGDDRLTRALTRFRHTNVSSEDPNDVFNIRYVRLAKSVMLAHLLLTDPTAVKGDAPVLRTRYAALVRLESANPIKP